jgi:hypothetical protein
MIVAIEAAKIIFFIKGPPKNSSMLNCKCRVFDFKRKFLQKNKKKNRLFSIICRKLADFL